MEKAFQLRWARGDQARFHEEGEWQLRFRDGAAHDFANARLSPDKWLSRHNIPCDESIYTFHRQGDVADPLANLLAAGLPEGEIEIAIDQIATYRSVDQNNSTVTYVCKHADTGRYHPEPGPTVLTAKTETCTSCAKKLASGAEEVRVHDNHNVARTWRFPDGK